MYEGQLVVMNSQRCCFLLHSELRLRRKHFLTIALCAAASIPRSCPLGPRVSKTLQSELTALAPQCDKEPTLLAVALDSGFSIILASEDFFFFHYISFSCFHYKLSHTFKETIYIFYPAFSGILCRGDSYIWSATLLIVKLLHYSSLL